MTINLISEKMLIVYNTICIGRREDEIVDGTKSEMAVLMGYFSRCWVIHVCSGPGVVRADRRTHYACIERCGMFTGGDGSYGRIDGWGWKSALQRKA